MILIELKNYLREVKRANLSELHYYFKLDALTLRDMLEHLIRKGFVSKKTKTNSCGTTCNQCELATIEIYEWVEKP